MTLAISANASNFHLGKVTLSVTGATGRLPVGSPVYNIAFSGSYDSWTGGADGGLSAPTTSYVLSGMPAVGYVAPNGHDWYSELQYIARSVSGLTIGHIYTFTAVVKVYNGPSSVLMRASAVGLTYPDPVAVNKSSYTTLTTTFTATATTHVLAIGRTTGSSATILIKSATVQRYSTATGSVYLTRTDGNGAHFVRLTENAAPNSSGAMTVVDYEAAYGGCTYRVVDAAGNQATTTVTPESASSPAARPVQLVATGKVGAVLGLERLESFDRDFEYRETGSALAILGRSGPVVTTRSDNQWTLRQGTLSFYAADQTEAEAIVGIYKASRVVFLRTAEFLPDMYHVASSVAVRPAQLQPSGWTYKVEVDYQEVQWPEGYLAGDDWTYADLIASYLAYFDLPANYATYAAMASG